MLKRSGAEPMFQAKTIFSHISVGGKWRANHPLCLSSIRSLGFFVAKTSVAGFQSPSVALWVDVYLGPLFQTVSCMTSPV